MRLIDADALIENQFKNDISYKAFVNLVKRQPTIEAEPSLEDCACCVLMKKAEPREDDDELDKSIADLERFMTQTHIKSIAIEQEDIKQLVSWQKELRERRRSG